MQLVWSALSHFAKVSGALAYMKEGKFGSGSSASFLAGFGPQYVRTETWSGSEVTIVGFLAWADIDSSSIVCLLVLVACVYQDGI
ncbi:hypothetical protein BCON_0361g00080 [Botryotinia convoluta]|uniref:Uncharacterized protein n=1 Tax=Botryotinia convoluta TaxID=54673 RepID=A0A4Z1H9M0_9HELO|nr:hypothetical protein BCON_0361g00080 [Botryotinia convoluta]